MLKIPKELRRKGLMVYKGKFSRVVLTAPYVNTARNRRLAFGQRKEYFAWMQS